MKRLMTTINQVLTQNTLKGNILGISVGSLIIASIGTMQDILIHP